MYTLVLNESFSTAGTKHILYMHLALFTLSLKYSCSFKLSKDLQKACTRISNNVCCVPLTDAVTQEGCTTKRTGRRDYKPSMRIKTGILT